MDDKALIQLKEQTRFYISNPEKAAEALLFVKYLKKYADELESKVKDRVVEVMDREGVELISYEIVDKETGEVQTFEAKRSYGTITKEYQPQNVLEALGQESLRFMKVQKGKLEEYLKKETAKGSVSMEAMEKALRDPIEKTRKGAKVIIREVK